LFHKCFSQCFEFAIHIDKEFADAIDEGCEVATEFLLKLVNDGRAGSVRHEAAARDVICKLDEFCILVV
jgi:hypothetical protein